MISQEEGQRRLEQFRRPERGALRELAAQARLSSAGRRVVGWLDGAEDDESAGEVGRLIDEMSERERLRVMRVVSPQLADSLLHWWGVAHEQPYQLGWGRRGYRSSRPEDSVDRRAAELRGMSLRAAQFDQPAEWWARWSAYVSHSGFATLLATEVDRGNAEVLRVLRDAAAGRDEVAGMSPDVVGSLSRCSDPEAWQVLDRLLRAAGRQEGLRQSILEHTDLAHPGARELFIRTVVDEGYTRFASAIRAVGTWWGEEFEVRQDKQVREHLATWLPMLAEPPTDITSLTAPDAFLALQAHGLADARAAVVTAGGLLGHESAEHRLAAVRVLREIDLPASRAAAMQVVTDPDPRVVAVALEAVTSTGWTTTRQLSEAGARLVLELLPGLPAKAQTLSTGLLGKRESTQGRSHVADALLRSAGPAVRDLVEPAYEWASAHGRYERVLEWSHDPKAHRAELMSALTDLSSSNRRLAARALSALEQVTEEEALALETALSRTASDQRTLALRFLARQDAAGVTASIGRLRAGTADQQRGAEELATAAGITTSDAPEPASRAGVLVVRAADRTAPRRPEALGFAALHPDVAANVQHLLDSLTDFLQRHERTEVIVHTEPQPLGSLRWLPRVGDGSMPLWDVFGSWWETTAAGLTDGGLEALLVADFRVVHDSDWAAHRAKRVLGDVRWPKAFLEPNSLATDVVSALARTSLRPSWTEPYLHAVQEVTVDLDTGWLQRPLAAHAARGEEVAQTQWGGRGDIDCRHTLGCLGIDRWQDLHRRGMITREQLPDAWSLLRWIDEPEGCFDPVDGPYVTATGHEVGLYACGDERVPAAPDRHRPPSRLVLSAYDAGVATRADLVDAIAAGSHGDDPLLEITTRRRRPEWTDVAGLADVVAEVRDALVEGEIARGDLPAPTSLVSRQVSSVSGVRWARDLLLALGKRPFARGYDFGTDRESSLSRLIRASWPAPEDDEPTIDAALREVPQKRLLELAVYAPQWAGHVERVLGWPGLESGVWWLHAHTKDDAWTVPPETREEWAAEVSRHTPLDADDLVRGATDVQWFSDMSSELGEERFESLLGASKYASSSGGHKRAELFSRALRGLVDEDALRERIDDKRHQDSVRALGLLPVAEDEDVLRRYEFLRAWVASDRSSGSQRRASESLAVDVGMDNLARSAGYRDPQRLVWAMEAHAVADLASGQLSARDGDLAVTLSLDESGQPALVVRRGDKELKSVPAASVKRVPEISALRARVTALRKQGSRMRASLEAACVSGEAFSTTELADLFAHPMIAPLLRDLVVVSDEGVIGFADDARHVLTGDGDRVPLDGSPVRIAHPVDLLASDAWPDLQHRLFTDRRRQAFKQVFRELYTVTDAERSVADKSRRYAGHQVQARQAGGLFRARGWVSDFEVGFVKTFHAERLTVFCSLLDGWGSPTEVEDATIEDVWFLGQQGTVSLPEVPPRLFSEVMRDLDLVVSVAHSGGVDPETSESAVEVRRRLVEETAAMMSLPNVEVKGHHAFVEGTLGSYSVQLGSGIVHRLPGRSVCIVPVSAQHRGRIFLPFADDDPRTAEVVSKVLLLARDAKIQDPTILGQLR